MKTVQVVYTGTYKDGGTSSYREKQKPYTKYFIDGRIGSITKGKVFDRYPGDERARILNVKLETEIEPRKRCCHCSCGRH